MYGLFITMLSLLNQEITETTKSKQKPLGQFCQNCDKKDAASLKCSVYPNPTKLMWFRHGQQCAFNFKAAAMEKKVVNALKASKRAAKGA